MAAEQVFTTVTCGTDMVALDGTAAGITADITADAMEEVFTIPGITTGRIAISIDCMGQIIFLLNAISNA